MLSSHTTKGRKSAAVSSARSNGDSDTAVSRTSDPSGPDIGLPWRVNEFEVWDYKTSRPVYHLQDRRGVIVAVFLNLQVARYEAAKMNEPAIARGIECGSRALYNS